MCTAMTYRTRDFYFGRTLDYECGFVEEVTVTPRGYLGNRLAMIGMAYVVDGYPLYYDAVNEAGLCIAGLNFVENARYPAAQGLAPYQLIPDLLGQCESLAQARERLEEMRLCERGYGELPAARLHWLVADRTGCLAVEPLGEGLAVYDNPVGVLTNDPPFPLQCQALRRFRHLSAQTPPNTFGLPLREAGRGTGSIGLPGDFTSHGRFVRAAFVRANAVSLRGEEESVNQLFHLLSAVSIPRGVCRMGDGHYHHTLYTCCINADRGRYYVCHYDDPTRRLLELKGASQDGLTRMPLKKRKTE